MWEKEGKKELCDSCGTPKVFFVQHAHGNYPLLDFVCPKCDVGEEETHSEGVEGSG